MLVARSPARLQVAHEWRRPARDQPLVAVPTDQVAQPAPDSASRLHPVTARLLLAHAHRARHLLADRSVLEHVTPSRRDELVAEIRRMRRVMRSLESEIEVTTRSVEAMSELVDHLRRLTGLLRHSNLLPPASDLNAITTGVESPELPR